MSHPRERTLDMKKFLVAVDAEGLSDHALHAGFELARALGAEVELIHAVSPAIPSAGLLADPRAVAANADILSRATEAMVAHVESVLKANRIDPVETRERVRVEEGPASKVIVARARSIVADVIFLGTHRRRGVVDFGSTVRAVLAQAPRAVWIQPVPFQAIRRILVPIDLSPDSLQALAMARALAQTLSARVRVVHCFRSTSYMISAWPDYPDLASTVAIDEVRDATKQEFQRTLAAFAWGGVEHDAQFVDGDPAETILELARGCDLVAMGTHGRTGLASALLGNVAYGVLKRSEKPVLAIRHPEREFLT